MCYKEDISMKIDIDIQTHHHFLKPFEAQRTSAAISAAISATELKRFCSQITL